MRLSRTPRLRTNAAQARVNAWCGAYVLGRSGMPSTGTGHDDAGQRAADDGTVTILRELFMGDRKILVKTPYQSLAEACR